MVNALLIISSIFGIALIVTICLQTSKAESFSAAMGGADSGPMRKGSREELLGRLTKYFAIAWIASAALLSVLWYHTV